MIELLLEAERALAVGMLDRAERLYGQVAAADPRNAIALVGLARIAVERDDEIGALDLGERALAVDPENQAARRLVDRIAEVRRYRGEGAYVPPAAPAPRGQPGDRRPDPPPEPSREPATGLGRLRRWFRRG